MDDNREQEGQLNSRPASILRASGSYRNSHLSNHPSITINLPTDAAAGRESGSDASDAQAQQQSHQRREQFEQLRREHYHNMFSTVHGQRLKRQSPPSVQKTSPGKPPAVTGSSRGPADKEPSRREGSQSPKKEPQAQKQ